MLESLSADEMAELGKLGVMINFPPGARIIGEGDVIGDIYVVSSGSVQITKHVGGVEEPIELLKPGDFFGELIDERNEKSLVSAVALTSTSVLRTASKDMAQFAFGHPQIGLTIARLLSVRVRSLENVTERRLEQQRQTCGKEINHLNLIIKAAQAVNTSLKLERVLQLILDEALQATDATRGTIYLVDDLTSEIVSHIIVGDELTEIRQPIGQGISGYVAKTGETVCIDDAYQDSRFNPEFDRMSGFRTKNMLCVAMRNRADKIVGVFQLMNKREENFTAEDEIFLKGISIHASIAIENSQMLLQMVKGERLSAVGRMAGAIIHDIKNPMTTIRLYAQVLKKQVNNKEAADLVDEITKQIDRLVRIAQEVLDFSRDIPSLRIQKISLDEFLSGITLFLNNDFEKRQIKLVNESSYHGEIEGDTDRLNRVIMNIATNAADAMPTGGEFTIRARDDNGCLIMELADNGPGIPEQVMKRIFEPFVTYGKEHGTGLGMAIVKRIVDEHKGDVKIISESGKGTRVVIKLPLNQKR